MAIPISECGYPHKNEDIPKKMRILIQKFALGMLYSKTRTRLSQPSGLVIYYYALETHLPEYPYKTSITYSGDSWTPKDKLTILFCPKLFFTFQEGKEHIAKPVDKITDQGGKKEKSMKIKQEKP